MRATQEEINHIDRLYEGRTVFHGDLHNHAATGGTSDGQCTLAEWKEQLRSLNMDFAAILDHKQVRHMYLPEWEDGLFICGTEPGTGILDSSAEYSKLHYNILYPTPKHLEQMLEAFPEYEFSGGQEGYFIYPRFVTERFRELIQYIRKTGGLFVHPHPKQVMISENPLDFWFADETGIEVFYGDMRNQETSLNYDLWLSLLALEKRVWACAGSDAHGRTKDTALTTVYATELSSAAIVKQASVGDFVCGPVGIRMCIGDWRMGGTCSFENQHLIVAVDDFHSTVKKESHTYRLDLLNEDGVVFSQEFDCSQPIYFSFEALPCKFYRTEVFDVTENLRIAIGNPIWNSDRMALS